MKNLSDNEVKELSKEINSFESEKAMSLFIEKNISHFCYHILGDNYISHNKEYKPIKTKKFIKDVPNIRIDFLIECENKSYCVELKNPSNVFSELSRVVSQLMVYDIFLNDKDIEFVIVTSKHHEIIPMMIKKFNLKFRYIVLNKVFCAEMVG